VTHLTAGCHVPPTASAAAARQVLPGYCTFVLSNKTADRNPTLTITGFAKAPSMYPR